MNNERQIFVDDTLVPADQALLSAYDHGVLYGDGVYEGMRAYGGAVFELDAHLRRLERSAKCLRLMLPMDHAGLVAAIRSTLLANGLDDAYIRLVVTRGTGAIGPDPRTCARPRLLIIAEPVPPAHGAGAAEHGLSAQVTGVRRDAVDGTTHQVKSLNYLNSVQAYLEAQAAGADESIMLDARGFVSESTVCNVFVVRDGELLTPGESAAILRGITRDVVLELAGEIPGAVVAERDVTPFELTTAEEVFLTGTHAEIVPVTRINGIPVGDGRPGPFFRDIAGRFRRATSDPRRTTPVTSPQTAGTR